MPNDEPYVGEVVTEEEKPKTMPVIEVEPVKTGALVRVDVPITLEQVAVEETALEIIRSRIEIVKRLRAASIKLTNPEDWVLYKDRQERVVAYLQEDGVQRVAPLWGLEVFNIRGPERIDTDDEFTYIYTGDARSKFTGQHAEAIEGARSSSDDFCREKKGTAQHVAVRKAARANLDGRALRMLSGLDSVPMDELASTWTGTKKDVKNCRQGRGFEREKQQTDAASAGIPAEQFPTCPKCKGEMRFFPARQTDTGTMAAVFLCKKGKPCGGKIDLQSWKNKLAADARKAESGQPAAEGETLTSDDIPF